MLPLSATTGESTSSGVWEAPQGTTNTSKQVASRRLFIHSLLGMAAGAALTYVTTREQDEHPAIAPDEAMLAIQEELKQCRERMFVARTINDDGAIQDELYLAQWYEKRLQGILNQAPDISSVRMLNDRVNGRIAICTQLTHHLYAMDLSEEQQTSLKALLQEAQFLAHHSNMDALLSKSNGMQ